MNNPAQDEFNDLMAANAARVTHHPEDAPSSSDTEETNYTRSSSTLVPDTISSRPSGKPSKSSLRSSAYNHRRSSDSDSDVETGRGSSRGRTPYYIPNNHGYNENTGPKGVIADARAFERERRLGNKNTYVRTEGMVLPKMQHLQGEDGHLQQRRPDGANGTDEDEDLDEEGGADDFMRKWREKREEELRSGKWSGGARGRGRYGTMNTVDALGFLDAVERVPRDTVVLVYVYDDELPISEGYHHQLEELAAKYADVKFIALHFEDAEMEHAGVPAVLVYRNGDQFACLIPLEDYVPSGTGNTISLEGALRSRSVL